MDGFTILTHCVNSRVLDGKKIGSFIPKAACFWTAEWCAGVPLSEP
jgi:hypothetical protein